jgi:hypothetical protein
LDAFINWPTCRVPGYWDTLFATDCRVDSCSAGDSLVDGGCTTTPGSFDVAFAFESDA